jgi:predicted CXXCH cytochrome family protein
MPSYSLMALGVATLLCAACFPSLETPTAYSEGAPSTPSPVEADDDSACADCHREIYDRYRQTPMARASGPALAGLLLGSFQHAASGVQYGVFLRDDKAWMSYRRPSVRSASPADWDLSGERQLRYFIGSGHRGRTYLYEESGLWFEAPINYYSKKGIWDMAPNFQASRNMPDSLPIDSNCLHCHATDVQSALPSARNRYADVPFRQGGIGCVACHGNAAEHLARKGQGKIINPARLITSRRDDICLQCHLEGDAAVYRGGKSLADFRAGDDFAAYVNYFVKEGAEAGGGRAASQYEALLRSRCKIVSGDKLTCTTCHDPHGTPPESNRVAYFRDKCLGCHTGQRMALEHHPEQRDCAVCHMPTSATTDISHEQLTDHRIQRSPSSVQLRLSTPMEGPYRLMPVGATKAGDRELGLAYSQAALRGSQDARQLARQLLQRAEAAGADDAELHSQLGLIEQMSGHLSIAQTEYDLALLKDPDNSTALGNKAVLEASSGRAADAIHLLQRVVQNDPSQVAASLNLAFMECVAGDREGARKVLSNLSRFSPDNGTLQVFIHTGVYVGQRCNVSSETGWDKTR